MNTSLVFLFQFPTLIVSLFGQSMVPSDPLEYFSKGFLIKHLLYIEFSTSIENLKVVIS